VNASDNTGLGLFDDTASAVGNFPTALRGYDRTAVDDYVRTLEESVVKSRRHSAQLEQQVTVLQDEVASSGEKTDKDLDYANLGGRANDILRLAQEQARELVQNATIEAEKVKEQARREADGQHDERQRSDDVRRRDGRGWEAKAGDARQRRRLEEQRCPTVETSAADHSAEDDEPSDDANEADDDMDQGEHQRLEIIVFILPGRG